VLDFASPRVKTQYWWSMPKARPMQLALGEPAFPSTRYQGSKAKLTGFLRGIFSELTFDSALDAFSGTGSVAYLLKSLKKRVHANDVLRANASVARAIVANQGVRLDPARARRLFERDQAVTYRGFVEATFDGVFFLPDENRWVDTVSENIAKMLDPFERSLAEFSLFQACMKKRPFNLFHRKNLELRTRAVERTFGNKRTWDTPFADHFLEALGEANAAVFDGGAEVVVTNADALTLEAHADLVYLDPPYMNARGTSVDYLDFYHFLEGLTELDAWPSRIDRKRAHLSYAHERSSPFLSQTGIVRAFAELFDRHRSSILVVSYRSDGIPSAGELGKLLTDLGKKVRVHHADHQYALSQKRTHELVFVAE
jgi:adenine-specific DNA-methyltransferase